MNHSMKFFDNCFPDLSQKCYKKHKIININTNKKETLSHDRSTFRKKIKENLKKLNFQSNSLKYFLQNKHIYNNHYITYLSNKHFGDIHSKGISNIHNFISKKEPKSKETVVDQALYTGMKYNIMTSKNDPFYSSFIKIFKNKIERERYEKIHFEFALLRKLLQKYHEERKDISYKVL